MGRRGVSAPRGWAGEKYTRFNASEFILSKRGSNYIAMNRVLEAWKAVGQESLNLPNFITLVRILLIPVFVMLFFTPTPDRSLSAAFVFVVAAITDLLDGYIARRTGQVTKLGKLLDPIADKLLVLSALILLVNIDRVSALVAILVIAREVAVTGVRAA